MELVVWWDQGRRFWSVLLNIAEQQCRAQVKTLTCAAVRLVGRRALLCVLCENILNRVNEDFCRWRAASCCRYLKQKLGKPQHDNGCVQVQHSMLNFCDFPVCFLEVVSCLTSGLLKEKNISRRGCLLVNGWPTFSKAICLLKQICCQINSGILSQVGDDISWQTTDSAVSQRPLLALGASHD